jgi:hypothetical protein
MVDILNHLAGLPDLSNLLMFLIFLSGVALMALIIVFVIRENRKAVDRKTARAAELGFQPIPHPDPRLVKNILDLYRRTSNQRLDLWRVFHRSSFDGDLYLFDVEDPTGDGTTEIVTSAIAVVSPGASLPFFRIYPRLTGNGLAFRIANRILGWTANFQYNKIVKFSGVPQFDDCFIVTKPTDAPEMPLRDLLSPDLRHLLSGLQAVQINGGRDVLALSSSALSAIHKTEVDERIRSLISEAIRLSSYFFHH